MHADYNKCLLQSDALLQYILETSVYPREHEQLKELREATVENFPEKYHFMITEEQGQLISMLIKIMNAKRTLELGVFTGYSLLTTALALPVDGKVIAIDQNKDTFEFGLQFIRKAGVDHKINFIGSNAISALEEMVTNQEPEFDFALVDADKSNYKKYHEYMMKLVKVGGVIAYDDTLWFGTVVLGDDEVPQHLKADRKPILELNSSLASDPRIEISQLAPGDGITICRRVV